MKPGIKTTEFWVTVGSVTLIAFLDQVTTAPDLPKWALVVAPIVYTIARALTKIFGNES